MNDEQFLTSPEVARLLRVSRQTVVAMINRGDITAFRAGKRKWRINRSSVEALIHQPVILAPTGAAS